ncbi:hypothetical protein [Roseateles sp. P5_E7]
MPIPFLRRSLAALALLLAAPLASAGLVTYTVQGSFTGAATDDAALIAALNPLLTGQSLTVTVTLDLATAGSPLPGGATLYRAVTASTAQFAGFGSTSGSCPNVSELICTVQVRDGQTALVDPDRFNLFPAIAHSDALDAAAGLGRHLDLQFMLFFTDFSALALVNDSLGFDLSAANPALISGQLGVFSSNGQTFDAARFAFNVSRISADGAQALPEPGSLALSLLALVGLCGLRRASAAHRS